MDILSTKEISVRPNKDRITWIDVAKGLLIIMVVYSHINWLYSVSGLTVCEEWTILGKIGKYLWVPFYMPCFFLITGYCTGLDKNFKDFFSEKVISLLVPMLFLVFYIHWFLWSLFSSLLVCYFVNQKVKSIWWSLILFIGMSILGSLCHSAGMFVGFKRYYILQSLGLPLFIWLGRIIRKYSDLILDWKVLTLSTIIYLGIIIVYYMNDWKLPAIHAVYDVRIIDFPLHILLATMGSLMLLGISKVIKGNFILEYLGRNSLIVFLLHVNVILVYLKFVRNLEPTYILYFSILGVALSVCSVAAYILNKSVFSWLIGKINK